MGAFVEVPDEQCLLAYARGSPSLEDLDIIALSDEGSPVALDEGPDPRPALLVCPPHPRRLYVAVQAALGEGLAVVAAHMVPRDRSQAVAAALGARGSGASPRRADAWPGLDELVRARRRALGGTWEETRRVAVPVDVGAPAYTSVSIAAGECMDVFFVPDDDVGALDAELLDTEGRAVARARGGGDTRGLTVCSGTSLSGSLALRPHAGNGMVAVVMARSPDTFPLEGRVRPDFVAYAAAEPIDAATRGRNEALRAAGLGAPIATKSGFLGSSRRQTTWLDLTAACSRLDIVPGAPVGRVLAEAWDDLGSLLGSAENPSGTVLFVCAKGRVRLDLEGRSAPGPFAVLVRPAGWVTSELGAHPLAASRLLARSARGPRSLFEGAALSVRSIALSSARLSSLEDEVPAGSCLQFTIGVEGDGSGVDLRIVDARSADEIDRGHGETAAGARACASGAAPIRVRVEARSGHGQLHALLGTRRTP